MSPENPDFLFLFLFLKKLTKPQDQMQVGVLPKQKTNQEQQDTPSGLSGFSGLWHP